MKRELNAKVEIEFSEDQCKEFDENIEKYKSMLSAALKQHVDGIVFVVREKSEYKNKCSIHIK